MQKKSVFYSKSCKNNRPLLYIVSLSNSHDVQKKYFESPKIPMVPGPYISARTLTIEKAPHVTPNPNPDTKEREKHYETFYTYSI